MKEHKLCKYFSYEQEKYLCIWLYALDLFVEEILIDVKQSLLPEKNLAVCATKENCPNFATNLPEMKIFCELQEHIPLPQPFWLICL